jgi:uncharacterized protein (DUF1800 family)
MNFLRLSGRLGFALSSLILAGILRAPANAAIDLNNDGIPDIWAMVYEAGALAPAADSDGDGQSNANEAIAGTNPLGADSTVRIKSVLVDASGVHLTARTERGKKYQVQSTATLDPSDWQPAGSAEVAQYDETTFSVAGPNPTEKYYRLLVQDADTDEDGVADWEEIRVGFDPNNSHSGGLAGPDDLTAITQALQSPNVITAIATDASAAEPAAGVPALDGGSFLIVRSGNLNAITVTYAMSGGASSAIDYAPLAGTVQFPLGARSAIVSLTPLEDIIVESPEVAILTVQPGPGYVVGTPASAGVLIHDNVTANGTGLNARFWNEVASGANQISDTNPAKFAGNPVVSRVDGTIDFDWDSSSTQGVGSPAVGVNADYFSSRWTGEVLPQYSQVYTFSFEVNRAGRVWVNGTLLINNWPPNTVSSNTYTGTIELEAGVRYPIVVEQYDTTGASEAHLRWQSLNQPLQIIPKARLFPNTPPQILSASDVLLIQNSPPFTYQIVASGNPTGYSAINLPPGWTINSTTGVISGTPAEAGRWESVVTAVNAFGSGSAPLTIQVLATGNAIARDVWTGLPGTAVASIPLASPPTSSAPITLLEVPQSAPDVDDFGVRIRGYFTAPLTGVYKFWLTASDAAELYISDDDEPINAFKRAEVTGATGFRDWTNANAGKSPLLALVAGRRYYVEVRHKAGVGADHVSVGWLKPGEGGVDPAGASSPSEVVPGYTLSPYLPPAPLNGESTLYTTTMSAQPGAVTSGYGSGSLQLSADESQAILRYTYANLSTPVSAAHIHSDAHGGAIIFDIDDATPNADGSYTWEIMGAGALSAADVVQVIKTGQAYINVHTVNYPAGEIRGNFRLQAASQTFTPPADPPAWTNDSNDANAAARFLIQTTFGVQGADADADGIPDAIEQVQSLGYEGWINDQFTKAPTSHYAYVFTNRVQTDPGGATYPGRLAFNAWWRNSVTAPDQLRQRVAFALSEIMVVSENGVLTDRADTLSDYYDTLLAHALGTDLVPGIPPAQQVRGNFRDLLEAVTLHPAMGRYLDMLKNDKPDKTTGRIPNENYAREVLQLFSIGLNRMHPDGSLMLSSKGELIPTYDQNAIIGFAHAFTGWDYFYTGGYRTSFGAGSNWIEPMREVPVRHFTGQKRLLNNVVIPGLPVLNGQPLDPYASHNSTIYNNATYQALAAQELDATHDAIFNHPNCGPFISRQLIQRLVTSTPSRGYIYRVAQKFNDNGAGVRGDMKAVIKAILLDYEARSPQLLAQQGYGKQREPIVRVAGVARGLPAPNPVNGTYAQGQGSAPLNLITVTTAAPHLYANGQSAYLDFSGGNPSDPDDAAYAVTLGTTTQFTLRPLTTETASYAQSGNLITLTTNGVEFTAGESVYLDFVSGAPSSPPDGFYNVASVTSDELQFTVRPASSVTGAYSQTAAVITVTTPAPHTFAAGSSVYIDFTSGTPSSVPDGVFNVVTVAPDNLSFTIDAPDSVNRTGNCVATPAADSVNRTGGASSAFATKAAYAVARTGSVAVNYSDWSMDSTDTDLNQTPLNSPTVFNFFEPDYQFPGILANAGLITPEFQLTSDTSVIRQANFLWNGLFSDSLGQSGLSSFKSGGRDIFVDLRPWMGTNPANGLPWAHNNNLAALIDRLNTLFMAGQLPAGAKTIIRNYVQTLAYTTPTTNQLRDRIRAVVHLIVTSPDFTIQK